jgi:hypothetical protein
LKNSLSTIPVNLKVFHPHFRCVTAQTASVTREAEVQFTENLRGTVVNDRVLRIRCSVRAPRHPRGRKSQPKNFCEHEIGRWRIISTDLLALRRRPREAGIAIASCGVDRFSWIGWLSKCRVAAAATWDVGSRGVMRRIALLPSQQVENVAVKRYK